MKQKLSLAPPSALSRQTWRVPRRPATGSGGLSQRNRARLSRGLGFSIGAVSRLLMMRFPLWKPVWLVVSRPLVLISDVIFLHDTILSPYRK